MRPLRRELACASWRVFAGGADEPAPTRAGWIATAGACTAAAALREAGQWSLDYGPRDFDATHWWFHCRFDARDDDAILGLDGLATRARAWLNGELLVESSSMFTRHRCDAARLLRRAGNELLIHCAPLQEGLKQRRARPNWRAPMVADQQLRWWRTTLLGRTPGWSPPVAAVGPWRDVWIGPQESRLLDSLELHAALEGDDGVVRCRIGSLPNCEVELHLQRDGQRWSARLEQDTRADSLHGSVRVPRAARWWPHTHGEPALYEAHLVVRAAGTQTQVPLHPIGFREIALDTEGGRFGFTVNGVPVFCRGAVWMPLDVVSLRAPRESYVRALEQVRAAGMNMLRVPGTAVYEEDAFHEACDRAGVLVWQDFMFANMDYPRGDEAFDALARREVGEQLQRLHAHASLAILCGNSEAEQQAAMWGAPREMWRQPLFDETIARLCERHAPGVPYWPSSAHGGALPQQPAEGSSSYYGVGAYLRAPEDARLCDLKFASECLAFANVPAPATLSRMPGGAALRVHHPRWKERTPRDLGAGWDFEDVRDHYLHLLYGADARALRASDPERYFALSRKLTGDLMAGAFAHWRRPQSDCGGALVLMLRDLWAGAGWGLMDDAGLPKPCWYALRRVLQPLAAFITDEGMNGLVVHIVNDSPRPRTLQLHMQAWRDGEVQVEDARRTLDLAAHDARSIPLARLLDHFVDLNWSHRFGPPPCDVVSCRLVDERGADVALAGYVSVARFASAREDVGLRASARRLAASIWELTLSAQRFAWGVHIEWDGLEPEDDWFDLSPGGEARVILHGTPARFPNPVVHALNARAPAAVQVEEA